MEQKCRKYVFYITNHGFGHASRNVPLIKRLLSLSKSSQVVIKTDEARCDFLKRNLKDEADRICYYNNCYEIGLVMQQGKVLPDISLMKEKILEDFTQWDFYIQREVRFLQTYQPDIVIADVVPWALKAAKECNIKTLLIGNFTWADMYRSYFEEDIWRPYRDCYELADKALWYEIHTNELHEYCKNYECISMVSRAINTEEAERIKQSYERPIIFVSLGGSAELEETIDVSALPYDFVTTRGVCLRGENVHTLPKDMINTPDYIAASKYVIAKGGWSTVAEILHQQKKCALIFRGENSEDNNTKQVLESREHCVGISGNELVNMKEVIERIENLKPCGYDLYYDDTEKICDIIQSICQN